MTWRPYLPEPYPAFKMDDNDPEPVPLEVLWATRALCANFRLPPRQFRRRTSFGTSGWYRVESDIVAVNPDRSAANGMGGEDGYYAMLVHELLHATGHPSRLGRATTGDYGSELEEGTVCLAGRIVLAELGFPAEALEWHAPSNHYGFPADRDAAAAAAGWMLGYRVTAEAAAPRVLG